MSANPQQQSTRQQIQAEQDRKNQEANRAFLEATARGGDVKSIQALQDQGVPVVTTREGPYTRTYVGEQQVAEGIQRVQSGIYTDSSGQQQSNYGIDAGRSPYLTRVGDSYQVNPRYLQEQQNVQNQQMQTQKALQESIGPRARLELGPDGEVISSYSERLTDQGILGEERRTTKSQQTNNLADILAAPDDATFELEIGGQKKSGLTKRDVIDQYFAFEKQEKESESQIRTSLLEAKSQGTTYVYVTEGGKRKLMNIDKAIAKDFDFSQGVIVEPRQTAKQRVLMDKQDRELTAFAETAKQSGALFIKGTSESGAVKVFPVSTFRQDVKKEKDPLTFSFEPPVTRNLDTMTYADRVDAGISPKPKTIQENISYYADVAVKPIGDIFFPAAALVTGKEVKYTPSTGGKAIDALITSTKFTFGFGDKDQSGKPVDQSFPATFGPIAQEVAKDPLKVAVQIPAEIGLGIAGGGAVKAGTILTKKGIIEPVASRLAARQIETQLTRTFTGAAPRKTVTTIFKEPVTQRSITRQGQEIATEVVIPISRRVDRPAITVERIKGRPDLFKVEGGKTAEIAGESTKQGTKDVYIQKVGKDLIPVVVEQPIKETPKRVVVRGQIGFTEKDTLKAMEKSGLNIQVGKKGDQFMTEGKPSREMLQLLSTQVIKPTATVSQFTMKQVAENPRQFGRYFFGGESREQMQTALRNLEKPASGKPVDSFLVAETRSYGTVGSRIGTSSGKIIGTGKKALVSGLEWTEKIANPVKSNLPIVSQRIQSGLKNLGTAGRKDARLREIEERNIKGLERRKIQLAEQPAELERNVRGKGEREILKGTDIDKAGFRVGLGIFRKNIKSDELITIYHGTSKSSAEEILKSGFKGGKANQLWASPRKDIASSYGEVVLELTVKKPKLSLDNINKIVLSPNDVISVSGLGRKWQTLTVLQPKKSPLRAIGSKRPEIFSSPLGKYDEKSILRGSGKYKKQEFTITEKQKTTPIQQSDFTKPLKNLSRVERRNTIQQQRGYRKELIDLQNQLKLNPSSKSSEKIRSRVEQVSSFYRRNNELLGLTQPKTKKQPSVITPSRSFTTTITKKFQRRPKITDTFGPDVQGNIRFVDPYSISTMKATKSARKFSYPTDQATKGAAGGKGRARSLLQQESKSQRESSDYIPPRTRQDAFGEITDPVYLKAYPAFETATMSALEPSTITSRRPSFTTSPAISSKSISGVDFGVMGMRSTSQTIRTDNILLSRPQEQSGMRNLEKMITGEILKTGQTTRQTIIPILTTRITTTTIPRQTPKQDTITLQTFRGFGVSRFAGDTFPSRPSRFGTETILPFGRIPRGGGGGGGFFGVGGRKGGGTALFKASVYNPLAPSLSIKEKKRGKKGERNLIF